MCMLKYNCTSKTVSSVTSYSCSGEIRRLANMLLHVIRLPGQLQHLRQCLISNMHIDITLENTHDNNIFYSS